MFSLDCYTLTQTANSLHAKGNRQATFFLGVNVQPIQVLIQLIVPRTLLLYHRVLTPSFRFHPTPLSEIVFASNPRDSPSLYRYVKMTANASAKEGASLSRPPVDGKDEKPLGGAAHRSINNANQRGAGGCAVVGKGFRAYPSHTSLHRVVPGIFYS